MSFLVLLVAAVGCSGSTTVIPDDSNAGGEDLDCPEFEHIPVTSPQIIGEPVTVNVHITDESGVLSAVLYYKVETQIVWQQISMDGPEPDFTATIPGKDVAGAGGMHYYIWAQDASPALNACTLPTDGEGRPFHFTIDAATKDSGS